MAETSTQLLSRYLDDAIAAEGSFEKQLRSFAEQPDDDEVRAAFLAHAAQIRSHRERLVERLEQLGDAPSGAKSFLADLYDMGPKLSEAGHVLEERITQNLIAAFTMETGECAMYEALASAASAAGDQQTELLARGMQSEARAAAELIFRFIPSRSKIAFNVLTPNEIDPAVETKAPDDRLL